jgi:hypothetical protein
VAVITLTTDFGVRDTYVAEMKAAILSVTRDVHIVDVTHDIARHDIAGGALALESAAAWFPSSTIHLAVVDPGVGTGRRGLAVVAADQIFIGPDNGLFTPFLRRPRWQAFELTAQEFRAPAVSRTFHGRDVFAPAAAHVARGLDPARLGPAVTDPVRLPWPEPRIGQGSVGGNVVHVDRFGNLITSIDGDAVAALGADVSVRVGGKTLPVVSTYGDLAPGRAGALVGSRDVWRSRFAREARRAFWALGAARPSSSVGRGLRR